jgi:uncharacterized repeat protein (TIGR03803 family)
VINARYLKLACLLFVCTAVAVSVSTAQTLATVVNFTGANGSNPQSTLVQGPDGNLYGTTYNGGFTNNDGTAYRITPGGAYVLLHSFGGPDGARPYSGLIVGTDGNFYGTTSLGGLGAGTVFKMTTAGAITTLYQFGGSGGTIPYGGLVQGTDGNFYGTTSGGGTNGHGTVFQLTPSGTLTYLYNFAGPDGADPYATLVQGTDGNFYGTTNQGGANNLGTVFNITSTGTLTTLYSFAGPDGSTPYASLVQGSDGNFYGTTSLGGTNSDGTVFQITSAGALTSLHSFCSPTNCNDGSLPYGGLIQGTDGSYYGSASSGGVHGDGTLYKITSAGVLTTLHSFNSADGRLPYSNLMLATNGDFYGTTYKGGPSDEGTTFALSPFPYQYTAVTPCRLLDTRNGSALQGGTVNTFDLVTLAQNNGCADLSTAAIYSLNVTLVPINGGPVSYLTIWPAGQNQPVVSTMNSLDGRIKANAAIVPSGAGNAVNIYVTNTTNVLVDIDAYFAPVGSSTLAFYPLTPCRVADTRNPDGSLGGPYLQGRQERDFPVPASACGIPASAQAYSLNFTVVPYNGQSLDYLTVWPTGEPQPVVSTLNNQTATIVANAALVAAGTSGQIAVYPSNNTQLVVDINGYFAPAGQGGLSLYPDTPCRVFDTRKVNGGQPFSGTLSPPVDVVASPCAVSPAAQAYVLNATVVPVPTLGYLTLWADGKPQPVVSTLNAIDGSITSNMAIVPGFNGKIEAYASGLTQLILDISSYFAP